jgi:hypothetical protein
MGCRLFDTILLSLPDGIQDLTLGSDRPFCPGWSLHRLNRFSSVKRLKVVLPVPASINLGLAGECGLNRLGLRAMAELPQLESVHLSIDTDDPKACLPFFLDFHIPRLKHLVLDRLLFREFLVLSNFLKQHVATLETVELYGITFEIGAQPIQEAIWRKGSGP